MFWEYCPLYHDNDSKMAGSLSHQPDLEAILTPLTLAQAQNHGPSSPWVINGQYYQSLVIYQDFECIRPSSKNASYANMLRLTDLALPDARVA